MIKKAPSYITSDGRSWLELKDAQLQEMVIEIFPNVTATDHEIEVVRRIVGSAELVIKILKTKARKPRESRVVKVKKRMKAVKLKPDENGLIDLSKAHEPA